MLSKSLEIARGLSALWVFLYHMRLNLDPGLFRRFADCGLLGVPAFFVISGYCMMASSRSTIVKGQTAGSFLRRRLRRIFPPFWASIAVCLAAPFFGAAIIWLRFGVLRFPSQPWYKLSIADWLGLVTLTKGLATTGATHKPWAPVNSVYWSLAIEVQFYLVMALAVLWRRGFLVVLAVATVGGVWWWRRGPFLSGLFMQYWAMFAFGLLLYTVLDKGLRPVPPLRPLDRAGQHGPHRRSDRRHTGIHRLLPQRNAGKADAFRLLLRRDSVGGQRRGTPRIEGPAGYPGDDRPG